VAVGLSWSVAVPKKGFRVDGAAHLPTIFKPTFPTLVGVAWSDAAELVPALSAALLYVPARSKLLMFAVPEKADRVDGAAHFPSTLKPSFFALGVTWSDAAELAPALAAALLYAPERPNPSADAKLSKASFIVYT
jgi:hypothetical protein